MEEPSSGKLWLLRRLFLLLLLLLVFVVMVEDLLDFPKE